VRLALRAPHVCHGSACCRSGESEHSFAVHFCSHRISWVVIETRWWQLLLHRRKPARLRSDLLKLGDPRIIVVNCLGS
jgi:hypothetical protein